MQLNGMESVIASNTNFIDVNWTQQLLLQEKTQEAEERTSTIYYRYADDEPDYLSEAKDIKEELKTPIQWVSFKQQYFNTSLVAEKPFTEGVIETKKMSKKKK